MERYIVQGDPLEFMAENEEHAAEQYLDALQSAGIGYLIVTKEGR